MKKLKVCIIVVAAFADLLDWIRNGYLVLINRIITMVMPDPNLECSNTVMNE